MECNHKPIAIYLKDSIIRNLPYQCKCKCLWEGKILVYKLLKIIHTFFINSKKFKLNLFDNWIYFIFIFNSNLTNLTILPSQKYTIIFYKYISNFVKL